MMDAIEKALGEMNVPMSKYHSERYSFVWGFPMRRLFADRLVLATGVIVILMAVLFALHHRSNGVIRLGARRQIQCGFLSLEGLRFLWLKPRLLQEINPLASLA